MDLIIRDESPRDFAAIEQIHRSAFEGDPHSRGNEQAIVRARTLVEAALRRLREAGGGAGCVLLGEPEFYARFGFEPDPALVLPEVPPGYFQAPRFAGATPVGVVTCHEAFQAQP